MTNFFSNPYVIANGCILISWIVVGILSTLGYCMDRHKDIYRPPFESSLYRKSNGSIFKYFIYSMFNVVMIFIILVVSFGINILIYLN